MMSFAILLFATLMATSSAASTRHRLTKSEKIIHDRDSKSIPEMPMNTEYTTAEQSQGMTATHGWLAIGRLLRILDSCLYPIICSIPPAIEIWVWFTLAMFVHI